MPIYIAPIVEGQTEQEHISSFLYRVWFELVSTSEPLIVLPSSRSKRDRLVNGDTDELTRKLNEASIRLEEKLANDPSGKGLILILFDADDDCPASLAPAILSVARPIKPQFSVSCVLPKKTIENWIYGGASTLGGIGKLPEVLPERDQFEERSAIKWLEKQVRSNNANFTYKKVVDAKPLLQSLDLHECRRNCPSFDKLCRDLESIAANPPQASATTDNIEKPAD